MRRIAAAALLFIATGRAGASDFNDLLPGAKAMGMGMAYTAIADDPSAMFFNPAGTANTPYSQAGISLGRMLSPVGTLSMGALTYMRPFEPINTATIGAAYYAGRQANGGNKDVFLFHFSEEIKVPQLYLTRPLKVGGNFKFINVDKDPATGGGNFGIGFDGGFLLRSRTGLSGSVTLLDLTTNLGVPHPTLSLGSAFTWQKWLTAAIDMRVRPNLTEVYPGVEASFLQGLLKARMGRGFQLDGITQTAFGVGVDFSPIILDVAMSVPTSGIHRQGGAYQASFNYRFGAPSFSGSFVGQAATQAETLKAEIENLRQQKKKLEEDNKAAATNSEIVESELRILEQRVRELDDRYRLLQKKKEELDYGLQESQLRQKAQLTPPAPMPLIHKPKPQPSPVWPQKHVVRPGETVRSLAKAYYGDPALWEQIYEANKDKIERGLPQEGSELIIPMPQAR